MRKDDEFVKEKTAFLNHEQSRITASAERAFLKVFGGGCQLPIAAHAKLEDGRLRLVGLIGNLDGTKIIRDEIIGSEEESESLGGELAEKMLSSGGREILKELVTSK
jgi:hydroxymethylbilane synthase